jgi:Holliday junction resolvase RusA-like endonuclease
MITWTEEQLTKILQSNPALRIDLKYSQPARKKHSLPRSPRIVLPPMRFYEVERPVRIIFPFTYPSLNRMLRMNWYERKRQEDEFRDAVRWELALNKIIGFRAPVVLEVKVYHPTIRFRDRDNYCMKWLKDALKGIVIVDDDPRYVAAEQVEFEKGKARIELRIMPVKEKKYEC